MKLIGIIGRLGSGKDLVGSIIQYIFDSKAMDYTISEKNYNTYMLNHHSNLSGWQIKKFAAKLKEVCSLLTGILVEDFEKREVKEMFLGREWDYTTYTYIGNSEDRDLDSKQNRMTVRDMLQIAGTDALRNKLHHNVWVNALYSDLKHNGKYIITDVRFPNEYESIKKRDGIIIRVFRDTGVVNNHISETALNGYSADYTIDNNGSISELIEKVNEIIKEL